MAKSRLSPFASACLAAGLLAACDNGAKEQAQETPPVAAPSEYVPLTGVPDPIFSGEDIPAVTLVNPAGEQLALDEVEGPVLLNLWATWCVPCVTEMPLLDDLAADYAGRLQVITVNEDGFGAEPVERFFARNELVHLPRWIDPDNALAAAFGGGAVLPLTVLYDAEGREVWRVIGAWEWDSEEARTRIDEALVQKAGASAE